MSVKPIVRDTFFLSHKAQPATPADKLAGKDLLDTLRAHRGDCVGMAANMIGVNKAIIAVAVGELLMYNPKILAKSGPYQTEEGCLSLSGIRPTTRYEQIEVSYQDALFRPRRQRFVGYLAQIIQHEMDHLEGILI